MSISLGAVVRDSLGREGIVCSKEARPSQAWLKEQVNLSSDYRTTEVQWWGVMPFGGGYLLCPEPELAWLRSATFEDFLTLVDTATVHGRERLAKLFPQFVDRVIGERQRPH